MLRGVRVRLSGRYVELRRAQAMVEYALIIVLIAVVVLVALAALGTGIAGTFNRVVEQLK